jgi:hypothetical protein
MVLRLLKLLVLSGIAFGGSSGRAETHRADGAAQGSAVEISRSGTWIGGRTSSFQVWMIAPEADVRRVAELCEQHRVAFQKKWTTAPRSDWNPRCEIVVYPTRTDFLRKLGPQANGSSGATTIDMDRGNIRARHIDIRGDAGDWQREVLPHELTHVVLADEFPQQRIPPWTDEGIAMLAESGHRLAQRRLDLEHAVQRGSFIDVRQVFALQDGPQFTQRNAFYAESVSLAAFLIRRGGSKKLIEFVHSAQAEGYERAAKRHYRFSSLDQLETQWYGEMLRTDLGLCANDD